MIKQHFAIITLLELLYLGASFQLAESYGQWSYQGEILRTLLRIISLGLAYWIYRNYCLTVNIAISPKGIIARPVMVSIALLLLFAVVYTNAENEPLIWQLTFAASGIIAGFREEIIYRGMLQNSLQNKYHSLTALLLATTVFTLSHIQYIYYQQTFAMLMTAVSGIIFGCIFIYSGKVLLTGLIHGLYDGLLSINIAPIRLDNTAGLPVLLLIMLLFLILTSKKIRNTKTAKAVDSS